MEDALCVCYWKAMDRDDRPSIRYCRSQFAAVSFLAGDADQRDESFWDGCIVLAGRLPVMSAAFFATITYLAANKTAYDEQHETPVATHRKPALFAVAIWQREPRTARRGK